LRAEHRALQGLKTKLSDAGIDATALFIEGATVEKLLLEIDRLDIGLVIIGSHSPSFLRDFFSGSTMKEVVREARCPVLVLPPPSD
jgi:nucleotide-binding universal stress UspA family protein